MKKLVTVWDARLEAEVPLAALPTRTHGSIIDPDRADKDNQEKIQESPYFHQYLQMITCVVDDQGYPVDDYFLEFFSSESIKEERGKAKAKARFPELR